MSFRFLPLVALVVALFFITFASSQGTWQYDPITYNLTLNDETPTTQVFLWPSGHLSLPAGIPGPLKITIETPVDVEICIQEFVEVTGNFSQNCNAGGYFYVNVNSSAVSNYLEVLDSLESEVALGFREDFYEVTKKLSFDYFGSLASGTYMHNQTFDTTLRLNTLYYISARFFSDNSSTIIVSLHYNSSLCATGKIGAADGSCATPVTLNTTVQSTLKYGPSGSSKSTRYLTVPVPSNLAESLTTNFTVTWINTTTSYNAYLLGSAQPSVNLQVYSRRNAVPDLVNNLYDASFNLTINGTSTVETVLQSPFVGLWYFTVINNSPYSLNITIGTHILVCENGQVGPYCNITSIDLTYQPTNNATWVVGNGGLQYFTVNRQHLVVGTGLEKLGSNAPALFASFLNWPSNTSNFVPAAGNTVNLITASIPVESMQIMNITNATWRIAAWTNEGQGYYIWANHACANNCTNNNVSEGTCNVNTGYCTCKSGYSGLWCEKSGLALVWIILIVIACAILLAIATGIPIACYLKSKKRKQYERV